VGERLGIKAASRLAGNRNPVVLYVAAAKRVLPSVVVDGVVQFDAEEVELWRRKVDADAGARLQASIEARDKTFRAINKKSPR